ncbi:hypothetical protein D088_940109 [Salmonella enterica subsp. houtenae serovar 16:z4,z32:-- str. RKS3027]|nr:hypothetical protein D088_940109 [Salmonella enterica subsp. houtenae serovar 16:z4,z32:-- str. RKS3027]
MTPLSMGHSPSGLSPLARGTHIHGARILAMLGFIPAGAGNSRLRAS